MDANTVIEWVKGEVSQIVEIVDDFVEEVVDFVEGTDNTESSETEEAPVTTAPVVETPAKTSVFVADPVTKT
jgi:hypothetical protein